MKDSSLASAALTTSVTSFNSYLFRDTLTINLRYILLVLCQFFIFKFLYPFPSFFSDSYSYIYAAASHLGANIWPIGYSRFLYYFHLITSSPTALTLFQYLFFEMIALYFYRTFLYYFSPSKLSRIALSFFLFLSPLNLYLANFVSSDGLFASLSLLWLTTLIRLIYQPKFSHLLILSVVSFICFSFRYNAMYYPVISAPVFLLNKKTIWFNLLGIALGPALIFPFILYTSNAAKEMSGVSQFPPILGGWQWANNALYMREYIEEDSSHFPNSKMAELDQLAREFYHRIPAEERLLDNYVGNYFIKEPRAPLKRYMSRHYGNDTSFGGVAAWAKPAPLFKEYGLYLIKKHPIAFFDHYIIINTKNYLIPPLEKLKIFNLGTNYVWPIAVMWFDYSGQKINSISPTFQGYLLAFYPIFFLVLNVLFAWNLFGFIHRRGFLKIDKKTSFAIGLISLLVLINAGFSIFANIIVFRYQIFPMFTLLLVVLLLIDYLDKNQHAITLKGTKPISR